MKYYEWSQEKNVKLQASRDVCFEDVQVAIESGRVLDVIEHPQQDKYAHQKVMIIELDNYAYLVPYVEDEKKLFLKTIIPSRKYTKLYLVDR